ncbi:MAG: hypothetical protein FJX77_10440 [Armatimonadetes bacterium]|nr:hypothetical protein [Armatimonadota bacterium]
MQSQPSRFRYWAVGAAAVAAVAGWSLNSRVQAAQAPRGKAAQTVGFAKGAWDHKALGPIAFSPAGVLFIADDQAGAIYGVDLMEERSQAQPFQAIPTLGETIGARMGTTGKGIQIKDVAVSPVSRKLYLTVRKTDGADQNAANPANYALFAVDPAGQVMQVDLSDKPFGKVMIQATPGFGRRGSMDTRLIGDIAFAPGRVLVSARSTEQFNSNLISVPVPFKQDGVERFATSIFHVNHKKQETASPIQTLSTYRDQGKTYLMAAFTCTPVVRFDLEELKPGATVNGTTVAELGSNSQPMNLIAYGRQGEQNLLVNNSLFGVVKVSAKVAKETAAVNEKAVDRGSRGQTPQPGIDPVDSLKGVAAYAAAGQNLVVVKTTESGVALESMPLP